MNGLGARDVLDQYHAQPIANYYHIIKVNIMLIAIARLLFPFILLQPKIQSIQKQPLSWLSRIWRLGLLNK